jgi:ubiquinol-cytochrome c reductase iron-sulfur subunit
MISQRLSGIVGLTKRNYPITLDIRNQFGLISEYNERANKKLNGFHSVPDKAQFFVTSARPGNFGDHIDFKSTIDNWFDENRVHNEH